MSTTKKIEALYREGKELQDSFGFFYSNLRPVLLEYATAIGTQHHKNVDEHLVVEMVDDLLMELSKFEGRSSFATYAYAYFRNQWIKEFRYQRKRLGDRLEDPSHDNQDSDAIVDGPAEEGRKPLDMTQALILKEFKSRLSGRELFVLESRIGRETFGDIGRHLGLSSQRAYEIWADILKQAEAYGEIG